MIALTSGFVPSCWLLLGAAGESCRSLGCSTASCKWWPVRIISQN